LSYGNHMEIEVLQFFVNTARESDFVLDLKHNRPR